MAPKFRAKNLRARSGCLMGLIGEAPMSLFCRGQTLQCAHKLPNPKPNKLIFPPPSPTDLGKPDQYSHRTGKTDRETVGKKQTKKPQLPETSTPFIILLAIPSATTCCLHYSNLNHKRWKTPQMGSTMGDQTIGSR